MKQDGAKVEGDKDIPKPENKQAGKNIFVDWTRFDEYAERVVGKIKTKLAAPEEPDAPSPGKSDDLPF